MRKFITAVCDYCCECGCCSAPATAASSATNIKTPADDATPPRFRDGQAHSPNPQQDATLDPSTFFRSRSSRLAAKTAAGGPNSFTLADICGRNTSQMSRRASKGVKRPRQQQGEEEDTQPSPLHLTAHPTLPLPLLSVPQAFRGMCVSAQLCKAQGASLFSFDQLSPRVNRRVSRPFAGAPVYDMSLTHGERLRVVACALTGNLVRLLSLGTGCSSTTTTSTVSTTTAPTPITATSTTTTITTQPQSPPTILPTSNRQAAGPPTAS
jgi:hypothetical protein